MALLSLVLVLALGVPTGVDAARRPLAPAPASDTLIRVSRGDRLALRRFSGSLDVVGWDRDEVLVEADPADQPVVRGWKEGSTVLLGVEDPKGRRLGRTVSVRVPVWMELDLQGTRLTATIEGVHAAVSVRTVEGDVRVSGVQGTVSARSVDGTVVVEEVRGPVTASTVEETVRVSRVQGTVRVESTDGDLVVEEVDGQLVEAVTVDGDVSFLGDLHAGGSYRLVTHDGDILVTVATDADADVSVSTFDGSFQAEFPVTVGRFQGGRAASFRLGEGGARLIVEAFDGDIWIRRRR